MVDYYDKLNSWYAKNIYVLKDKIDLNRRQAKMIRDKNQVIKVSIENTSQLADI